MRGKKKLFLICGIFGVALALLGWLNYGVSSEDTRTVLALQSKETFPIVQLETEEGVSVEPTCWGNKQKVVFIISTKCEVCEKNREHFDKFAKHLQEQGIVPVTVYQDMKKRPFKEFANMEAQYYLSDPDHKLTGTTPTLLLLNEKNEIIEKEVGANPNRIIERRLNFHESKY